MTGNATQRSSPSDRSTGRPGSHSRGPASRSMEKIVLGHLLILVVGISWAFGGQIGWARQALLAWGTVGIALFLYVLLFGGRSEARRQACFHLWPLALFDLAVGLSCLNPSFQSFLSQGELYFKLATPPHSWLPSSARPDLSLRELWQFNGIVLSCYNLVLVVRSRRALRNLLLFVAANSVLLAIFGTFQKFAGATGPWFVANRQTYFFSTFVYHNHWGAFTLLIAGVCVGLVFHYWQRGGFRDLWHSPVPAGAVATLLLTITIPLSGSRSSSVLLGLLLLGALVHGLSRIVGQYRERRQSATRPLVAIAVTAVVALAAILYLSQDVIAQRSKLTAEQVGQIRGENNLNSRLTLYRDTWRTAVVKPWFGWGLETYGDVFRIYNSQRADEVWFGQPYYREAHSDWLQSLAESGFVGTALLVLLGLMPLWPVRSRVFRSVLSRYLLAGCALVLLYAWVEFPFANPAVMIAFWLCLYSAAHYAAPDNAAKSGPDPLSG